MTRIEEIINAVSLDMHVNEVVNTPENRLTFLIKLRNQWLEDACHTTSRMLYIGTINIEILNLELMLEKSSMI